ncbi:capreomycidine synthase [Sulfidibacter corallicola]|uniref:Capreomycidine synthase n=1 Tax=Sulfidibacter corallicola TaxID=2818388 RepID=A0A8A4TM09_SULCO|nr:capreomycidine synthase [Sulfidibacter corallicola]QTD50142.1 capreomycidine synthase [Sulfidibacter corallicola]
MQLTRVPLEDWMRHYYFDTPIDLGSSGVYPYSFAEFKRITGFRDEALDALVFDDSDTMGAVGLRAAIADRWGDGDPDNVMVANGSNDASFLAMVGLLEAGDEVVVLDPIYHTLGSLLVSIGCQVKTVPLLWENQFAPNMDDMLAAIGPRTRMVVVNFPHNPTGVSISRTQQLRLIDACDKVGAYLVWDGAFHDLTFEAHQLPLPFPEYERAIVIGTMSKAYGMPGIRVGWCIGQAAHLAPCMLWKDYTSLYVSPWVEIVAQHAIAHADALCAPRKKEALENFAYLERWLDTQREHIAWTKPQGGVTAFIRFHHIDNTEPFCRSLAETCGVMLVPGTAFNNPKHARLGFAGPSKSFRKGLELLGSHCAASCPTHSPG